jgi:FlgD Ig-like domain
MPGRGIGSQTPRVASMTAGISEDWPAPALEIGVALLPLSRLMRIAAWVSPLLLVAPLTARAAWITDGNPLCTAARYQTEARAVSDGAGGIIVAWADLRNGNWDVYTQRLNAAGEPLWPVNGIPLCVLRGGQDPSQMVSDGAGGAIVIWHDYRCGSAIYAQRIDANGAPMWASDGVPVTVSSAGQTNALSVSDGAGGVIVAWNDGRGGTYAQRIDGDGRTRWGDGGVSLGYLSSPSLAEDGDGGVFVAYEYTTVAVQHLDSTGAPLWHGGLVVSYAGAGSNQVAAASDEAGGAIITWTDSRAGNSTHIWAQRIGPDGSPMWTPNGISLCSADGGQDSPAIVADGAHGALVAWLDHRFAPGVAIFSRRIDASGDTLWQAYGVPLCALLGTRSGLRLLGDHAGGAIVTWQDDRGGAWDIYAQRVTGDGVVHWGGYGTVLCGAAGNQTLPEIATDGRGGALVAWNDARVSASSAHIYAGRVDSVGVVANNVGVAHGGPRSFHLLAPAPNPAHGGVHVAFELPAAAGVSAEVFDLAGRRVRSLASRTLPAGIQSLEWDARDATGRPVPDGLYLVRVRAAGAEGRCRVVVTR